MSLAVLAIFFGLGSHVWLFDSGVVICAHIDLPEDVIFNMAKAFWLNLDEQYSSASWLRDVSVGKDFVDLNMPLYSGAKRYCQEVGALKVTSN